MNDMYWYVILYAFLEDAGIYWYKIDAMLQTFGRNKLLRTWRGFALRWGESFGHTCVAAAEEKDENCEIKAWRWDVCQQPLWSWVASQPDLFELLLLRWADVSLKKKFAIDSMRKLESKRW